MKKETILLVIVVLLVGVLGGVIYSNWKSDTVPSSSSSSPAAAPVPVVNYQQQIATLEGIVAREPENRNAWVQLGNNFFGADQPMKAIDAYDRALQLDADDPNVLTDQGTMYRRVGWYDRAISNFQRAAALDPNHLQSRYNMGVVYRYDLQDFANAVAAWESFLELNPQGDGAQQIRAEIEFMRTHPPVPQAPQQ
jgi:cytochrome c-type biogenesis protein CcmH/NrfG